jgi:broad specificity phosphatase PhoE
MKIVEILALIIGVLLALAMLAACASVPPAPAGPTYYVMRHLEKAEGPDPGLAEAGRAGAQRLAQRLDADPPRAIYVSTTRRARETAAPLAAQLGIAAKEYDPSDTPGLVARVRAEGGSVLIVGHSNTVPDIVAALGGARPAPLAETDYGSLWVVAPDGRTERLTL